MNTHGTIGLHRRGFPGSLPGRRRAGPVRAKAGHEVMFSPLVPEDDKKTASGKAVVFLGVPGQSC